MTPELLSTAAGIVLSLAFAYVPGLAPKYDALDSTVKRLIMAGLVFLVALGLFGAGCANLALFGVDPVQCTQAGALNLFELFVAALVANQATFLLATK